MCGLHSKRYTTQKLISIWGIWLQFEKKINISEWSIFVEWWPCETDLDQYHTRSPNKKALPQLHHSRLNTGLQWIGQKQIQDETINIDFFLFGAPYTWGFILSSSYWPRYLSIVTGGCYIIWFPSTTHSRLIHREILLVQEKQYIQLFVYMITQTYIIHHIHWMYFICVRGQWNCLMCISFERTTEEAALAGSFF